MSNLLDDTHDVQTGNGTSVLGSLTLGIVEVRRDSDNSVLDRLAKERLGHRAHLLENHSADLFGGEALPVTLDGNFDGRLALVGDNLERDQLLVMLNRLIAVATANQTLDVEDGVGRVQGSLVLGGITHQALSFLRPRHVGRRDTVTLIVGDNLDAAILVHTDAGVGGTQVDTDDGADLLIASLIVGGGHQAGAQHQQG